MDMKYVRSEKYDIPSLQEKIMGPNPVKLEEELLKGHRIPEGAVVCDLGNGNDCASGVDCGYCVYYIFDHKKEINRPASKLSGLF